MKHSMIKLIVGFVAAASTASMAYAAPKADLVQINLAVSKDDKIIDQSSVTTLTDKPQIWANGKDVYFKSVDSRSSNGSRSSLSSKLFIGVQAVYQPALEDESAQVKVSITDLEKISHFSDGQDGIGIDLPSYTTITASLPAEPGKTWTTTNSGYTIVVNEQIIPGGAE